MESHHQVFAASKFIAEAATPIYYESSGQKVVRSKSGHEQQLL
jgi:hypothetical protein